jgi:hypothetical protein
VLEAQLSTVTRQQALLAGQHATLRQRYAATVRQLQLVRAEQQRGVSLEDIAQLLLEALHQAYKSGRAYNACGRLHIAGFKAMAGLSNVQVPKSCRCCCYPWQQLILHKGTSAQAVLPSCQLLAAVLTELCTREGSAASESFHSPIDSFESAYSLRRAVQAAKTGSTCIGELRSSQPQIKTQIHRL